MNTELRALISLIFDSEKLIQDGISKNYFSLVTDAMALIGDVPYALMTWNDLLPELKALNTPANEQDLLSFIGQKLAAIPQLAGAQPKAIMEATVGIVNAAYAFEQAIVKAK